MSGSQPPGRGLYVSLLGIDGIGKSSLAQRLTRDLRERGLKVLPLSWRDCLDAQLPGWPQQALRTMWMDTYRLMFGSTIDQGQHIALPERYADWVEERAEERLSELAATPSSATTGPLAAAMVEFAGNLVLYSEVIRPALERGEIVVQETFPYKHVLKEYLLAVYAANRTGTGAYHPQEIDPLFTPMEEFFGGPLNPDVGVFVDGPPELALEWRLKQSGQVGVMEDLRIAGEPGFDGFVRLQSECARRFLEFARKYGWQRHEVRDAPAESNVRRGLDILLAEISRLRPHWQLGRCAGVAAEPAEPE